MKSMEAAAYKADLKRVVAAFRKKGGVVVLVTPMHRRTFRGKSITNSLKDFPDAVRQLAKEESVALIDLNAMSKSFYEALGPEKSGAAFKEGDGTHHSSYGAYELARCVVEGIKQNKLDLVKWLTDDVPAFDPGRPDRPEDFKVPASPGKMGPTPEGN